MHRWKSIIPFLLVIVQPACSGEGQSASPRPCAVQADCAAAPGTPLCDVDARVCVALPPGGEIGVQDGSPGSVALVPVYEPAQPAEPTDLAFNPSKPSELWIVNRLDDSVIIMQDPGAPDASWDRRVDPAADHFMHLPPALAFGVELPEWGMTWATCGDGDNGNDFMGPALFSADLDIFAIQTPDGLGSHLDMLHSTTFCRGIAHMDANVYWVFNSNKRSLDKYDFGVDHGPGADDHADGKIYRYAELTVLGLNGVPSHLAYNPADAQLYIADTGNKRIAKLDTQSGTPGASFDGMEPVEERRRVDGAVIADVVPAGMLEAPSGIELRGGLIYVTDHATSRFYVFDAAGQVVRTLDTGLPPGSLAGFTFGSDGKIYFTDLLSGRVYRIDP